MTTNILNHAITPAEDSVNKLNELVTEPKKPLSNSGTQQPAMQKAHPTYEQRVIDGFKQSADLCTSVLEGALDAIDRGNTSTAKAVMSALLDTFNRIR